MPATHRALQAAALAWKQWPMLCVSTPAAGAACHSLKAC
ncbi:lipoprotein, putative [Xanthomonas oryzae pv. oryzae PXO99A]|uniref:Lipoprotein, putative n=1 Tax=Xanthomonas oryzae pv. oryzae (strain PXO99A) TaxID=360094 RepID=A0A0K0GFI7_XANOP|nr:lipoprotein, putative [Xanthomonas oryzae pv. oryzae PXO99A]